MIDVPVKKFADKLSNILTPRLDSQEQQEVALALSDLMIAEVATDDKFGGKKIADKLRRLRNIAWQGDDAENKQDQLLRQQTTYDPMNRNAFKGAFEQAAKSKEARIRDYNTILNELSEREKKQLVEGYARLGHLYEIAGHIARENHFKSKGSAGGISEAVNTTQPGFESAETAIESLNKPHFEIVLTQHPTNVNSLEAIRALREIDKAAEQDDDVSLKTTVSKYLNTPLTPEDEHGKARNLTVADETKMVEYFLGNLYEDLPKTYQNFDTALASLNGYSDQKHRLNLDFAIGSWGSAGDKDGNDNVKSENTLEAIAIHKKAIIERYLLEMEKEPLVDFVARNQELKGNLEAARNELEKVLSELEIKRSKTNRNDIPISQEEFDAFSKRIAATTKNLEKNDFAKSLEAEFLNKKEQGRSEEAEASLELLRKVRTFGFNFAKIEYRETAKVYEEIVDHLVKEYMPEYEESLKNKREETLTDLIKNHSAEVGAAAKKFLSDIDATKLRDYSSSENGIDAKVYHTLKRMELARDFPDMIKDNVLAECQNTANLLEAVFLQTASLNEQGNQARLGVIPLFEESDTLVAAPDTITRAFKNDAYVAHVKNLYGNSQSEIAQQVQIAHSDNARRSGVTAARGYIHAAHEKIEEAAKQITVDGKPIKLRFFQGGSQSDAYRNGVRALSAMVDAFDLHEYTKTTFQGGDLLNYLNHPSSIIRLLDRTFTHTAKRLSNKKNGHATPRVEELETVVTKALQNTLDSYAAEHFNEHINQIGMLFDSLGENKDKMISAMNIGSRSPKRKTSDSKKGTDVTQVRTITFSQLFTTGFGVIPSWLGAETIEDTLNSEIKKLGSAIAVNLNLKNGGTDSTSITIPSEKYFDANKRLNPEALSIIYKNSPSFKDTIDKLAYGILASDMTKISKLANDDKIDYQLKAYSNKLMSDYYKVASYVYRALNGKEMVEVEKPNLLDCEKAKFAIKHSKSISHLMGMDVKDRYRQFSDVLFDAGIFTLEDPLALRANQSAVATVYHGRTFAADDPAYGLSHYQNHVQSFSPRL